MRVEHIAIWVMDLERMRQFYSEYFNGTCGEKYCNVKTGFESYFISFDSGTRLEIMKKPGLSRPEERAPNSHYGYAHIAFSLGSREKVDELTLRLAGDSYQVISGPRITGDGYYESAVLDPEGNVLEIIA